MNAYLTPDAPSGDPVGRVLYIPDTLLPSVNGALQELAEEYNWEAFGDMTPEDAAYACQLMLEDYYESEVMTDTSPVLTELPLWLNQNGVALSYNGDANQNYGEYWNYASPSSANLTVWDVQVQPGSYRLIMLVEKTTNLGIAHLLLDGVRLANTIDLYAATLTRNLIVGFAPIDILDSARHEIGFEMHTKNASSTNYNIRVTSIILRREP